MEQHQEGLVMLFIVNSAICNDDRRLQETLETLESIWTRYPTADIWIAESSPVALSSAFVGCLPARARLFPFWDDEHVKFVASKPWNLGFRKSATEAYTTRELLRQPIYADRVFKLSGRYVLTDDFDPESHRLATFRERLPTGFSQDECGTDGMLMTRLYSFSRELVPQIRSVLGEIQQFHWRQWESGRVFDLEHGFWKFLPRDILHEVGKIGVRGRIGHLEHYVED
jgi:hypothetical protein